MKFKLLLIALLFVGFGAKSQITSSFFGHLHYSGTTTRHADGIGIVFADSTYSGFRPTATAAIGYSSNGGTTVLAFAGIGYFHVTHQAATNTYYTNYGVSLQLGTGASNGSVSLSNATTIGLFGHLFNNILTAGIGYNFSNKTYLPLTGPGVAFH